MSKKYDEFVKNNIIESNNILEFDKVIPMIPERDPELERELRDRAIISVVTMALKKGKELSYGEIRLFVDDDLSELEYEGRINLNSKKNNK